MGEKPDEIRRQIVEARNRLGQDLNELEYRVKRSTDLRAQFDQHPWVFMGVAFGLSVLVSMMVFNRR